MKFGNLSFSDAINSRLSSRTCKHSCTYEITNWSNNAQLFKEIVTRSYWWNCLDKFSLNLSKTKFADKGTGLSKWNCNMRNGFFSFNFYMKDKKTKGLEIELILWQNHGCRIRFQVISNFSYATPCTTHCKNHKLRVDDFAANIKQFLRKEWFQIKR